MRMHVCYLDCHEAGLCCYLVIKVNLSLCLSYYALRHEGVWESGCIDPRFLDLGTSWK
jgi:hypothetical protein